VITNGLNEQGGVVARGLNPRGIAVYVGIVRAMGTVYVVLLSLVEVER